MAEFTIALENFSKKAAKNIDAATRKIALGVFRGVILKTPVKSGRARGNWQASTGSPAIGELGSVHNAKTGGAPIARAAAECSKWDPKSGPIFLTNNLPYIEPLENGSSKQAPAGMVAVTIAEYGGIAADAAREVGQ